MISEVMGSLRKPINFILIHLDLLQKSLMKESPVSILPLPYPGKVPGMMCHVPSPVPPIMPLSYKKSKDI